MIFHPVSHITIHPVCIAVLTHSDNTNRLYCKALRNLSQADNTNRLYCKALRNLSQADNTNRLYCSSSLKSIIQIVCIAGG